MTWVKLDDRFPDNPKVAALSDSAAWLYVRGLCYCSRHLTDGLLTAAVISKVLRAKRRDVRELVECGLWHELQTGSVVVHDYLEYNSSRADVEKRLENAAERVAKHRSSRKVTPDVTPLQPRDGNAGVTPPDPIPSDTDPDLPPVGPPAGGTRASTKRSKARKEPARTLPDDWAPKPKHTETARSRGLTLELEERRFRESARANGRRYVDWDAAFNNWLLSPYAKPANGAAPEPDRPLRASEQAVYERLMGGSRG